MKKSDLNPLLRAQLETDGVDLDRMITFLNDLNAGSYCIPNAMGYESVPDPDHPSLIDLRGNIVWKMSSAQCRERFSFLGLPFSPESVGVCKDDTIVFDEGALRIIGISLYPKTAYGLLNGGCGTSYIDVKKNTAFNEEIFTTYEKCFETFAEQCRGKPKGLTPAYINEDFSPGYSFLLLKLRMILEHKKLYHDLTGSLPDVILPSFQLTSLHTDKAIQQAFREYSMLPELKSIADSIGCCSIEMFTETQSLMAGITRASQGEPWSIFDCAYGNTNTGIALPGGHGQCFELLAPIYQKMYNQGIRYVWIGNIDNIGYTIDPVSLAIFALSGKEASFEESCRTSVDVKGGVLLYNTAGRFNCADIGVSISGETVQSFEEEGKSVLFNCGIGLFDLEKLLARIPRLSRELPFRISAQDKDAGVYAQAEQITWEIIGLLDDPLFFMVEKKRRFIAAKMLIETILTSFPPDENDFPEISAVSVSLNQGAAELFKNEYGLVQEGGRWRI